MPIIRVEKSRDNPYAQIHRDTLQDTSLSWKARGLLAYLLSKPDDWKIQKSHLKEEAPDGKCSLNSGLDELKEAGYIEQEQKRNDHGQIEGYVYTIYEIPNSEIGESRTRKSDHGKSSPTKKQTSQTKKEEQLKKDNNNELRDTLKELGVNEGMVNQMVDQLCEKEANEMQRAKFLKSLQYDVEEKGKNGGHVVWAIRNYEKYEITDYEDSSDSRVETGIDYPEADYDASKYV
jgi:hypothetical protein